jgi:hypothetical protein
MHELILAAKDSDLFNVVVFAASISIRRRRKLIKEAATIYIAIASVNCLLIECH